MPEKPEINLSITWWRSVSIKSHRGPLKPSSESYTYKIIKLGFAALSEAVFFSFFFQILQAENP